MPPTHCWLVTLWDDNIWMSLLRTVSGGSLRPQNFIPAGTEPKEMSRYQTGCWLADFSCFKRQLFYLNVCFSADWIVCTYIVYLKNKSLLIPVKLWDIGGGQKLTSFIFTETGMSQFVLRCPWKFSRGVKLPTVPHIVRLDQKSICPAAWLPSLC